MSDEWDKKFNDVVQSMEKRDEEWHKKFNDVVQSMEKRDEEWHKKFNDVVQSMEKRDEEWHKKFNDVVQFVKGTTSNASAPSGNILLEKGTSGIGYGVASGTSSHLPNSQKQQTDLSPQFFDLLNQLKNDAAPLEGTASNASAPSGNILLEKGTSGIGYSVASGTTSHLPSSSYGVASGTSSHLPNSQKQQTDLSPGFFDILNQVQRETAPLETDQLQPSNVFSSAAPAKSSNILAAPPHGLPYSSVQQQNIFGSDQNDTSFLRQQQSGVDEYYSIPPPSSAKRRQQISIDQTDQIQSSSTSTKRTKFSSPSKSQQSCTSSPSKAKAHCPVVNCTVERATVAGLYDHVPLNHGEKVWEFAKLHDVRSGVDLIGINQDGTPYLTQPPTMGNNEDE